MGRTNPTFRDVLDRVRDRWRPFRRGLRRREQAAFDDVLARAGDHADAAAYANPEDPEVLVLLSVLVAQERELADLAERLDRVETQLDAREGSDRPGDPRGGRETDRRPGQRRGRRDPGTGGTDREEFLRGAGRTSDGTDGTDGPTYGGVIDEFLR